MLKTNGKLLASAILLVSGCNLAEARDINIGVLLSFTGPIESMTPGMADSVDQALAEANTSGRFLNGSKLVDIRADATCTDASAATAAAERLVSAEKVTAIVGADCSGATIAVLNNVAVPNQTVMVSPASTSPALTTIDDKGLFFRVAPSDARQGQVLSDILIGRDIRKVAVTYTNNDYGKGLSDAFTAAFKTAGGVVTIEAPHDEAKGDYSAEVGALASAGGDLLVVLGYYNQGGKAIVRSALELGAFSSFAFGDGMFSQDLISSIGDGLNGAIGVVPSSEGDAAEAAAKAGIDGNGPYRRESYDAAAIVALALQKSGGASGDALKQAITAVTNTPGEKIFAGQLAKGLEILSKGGEIDYVGATNVEFLEPGEAAGTYREYVVTDGHYQTVRFR